MVHLLDTSLARLAVVRPWRLVGLTFAAISIRLACCKFARVFLWSVGRILDVFMPVFWDSARICEARSPVANKQTSYKAIKDVRVV
jgi:hypothetical protein